MTFFQAEMNKAQEAIQRVRELHKPIQYDMDSEIMICQECKSLCHSYSGLGCEIPTDAQYPCWTIKALDGEIGSVEPVKSEALDGEQE